MIRYPRIGSGFSPFSPCYETFVTEGYRDRMDLMQQVELAGKVKGLSGIALDYPCQFTMKDLPAILDACRKQNQQICTVEAGIYPDRKWKEGSISSPDHGIRKDALHICMETLNVAAEAGASSVLLWPGQDGFDYPFQADYGKAWRLLIDGIIEVASHRRDIRIGIEYKPKEPRTNLFVRNAGTLLYLLKTVNMDNVGGVIDFGHSLVAGENPAEAAVLLAGEGKLFEVHLNDNYRDYDHDMMVGSINFWETVEFFYWLDKLGFDGWFLMDVFPYREDGLKALQRSVDNTFALMDIASELKCSGLEKFLENRDAIGSYSILWKNILKERGQGELK